MQEGILFHSLYEPGCGMYFIQLSCTLSGQLEEDAFRRAWETVVQRHAIFRTSFAWEGLERAYQVVHRRVELPWESQDYRALPLEEQRAELESVWNEDQRRDFDFRAGAPDCVAG